MASLPQMIQNRMDALGISSAADAAKQAGVSYPSFRKVLAGQGRLNKRTLSSWATWLGTDEETVLAAQGGGAKASRTRSKAQAPSTPAKRPGRRAAPAQATEAADSPFQVSILGYTKTFASVAELRAFVDEFEAFLAE